MAIRRGKEDELKKRSGEREGCGFETKRGRELLSRVGVEFEVTKFREVTGSLEAGVGWGRGGLSPSEAPPFAEIINK